MYVEIEPTMIEGMVALRDIKSDFYEFDEEKYQLAGKRTHKIYRLGDPVKIRVKATNLEQRLLDYELVDDIAAKGGTAALGHDGDSASEGLSENSPKTRSRASYKKGKK
jgi:ribonuclease R